MPPSLTEADYRQVILRPAEKVGLAVEPELVTVLLQDINQGVGDLPLLEFVLEQIWEKRQPGQLALQVYQNEVGGLKGALERKAQAVYDSLSPTAQSCARWIFLNLTQVGEGTEDTRRRIAKSDLVVAKYPRALVDETLQTLTAAKLVVVNAEDSLTPQRDTVLAGQSRGYDKFSSALNEADANAGASLLAGVPPVTVEVAHEILIRHWSTLRWWLEENRTKLRSQRQVEQAALAWKQNNYEQDFLLRGVPLDAAVELYVNYTDELSDDVQQFVEAGMAARNAEQTLTKKRLQQALRAIALISSLALGAVSLGIIAYLQRQQSRLREVEALNALAAAQMANDQYLDATVTAVSAGEQLQSIRTLGVLESAASVIRQQTIGTLQQATTLSGGEAQRVKLSKELAKRSTGRTLYILDEPTTGLHFEDVRKLLEVLHELVDQGNSVVVIEHNLDVVKTADHIIDIGPEGGDGGGRIVASGTPEEVCEVAESHTGQYLKPMLKGARIAAE